MRSSSLLILTAAVVVLGVLSAAPGTAAFAPSSLPGVRVSTTAVHGNTKFAPSLPPIKDISYGEESRKYRRTVYSHDDWRKHRSPDRFLYYIVSLFSSGIYKNLGREVTATTAIATFIVLYNAVTGGYTDFEGIKHAAVISSEWLPMLGLPLAPFTLSTPSLGLLLGTYTCVCLMTGSFGCCYLHICHAVSRSTQSFVPTHLTSAYV
jgi:ion channel-forming bestrophin family protein